MKVLSKLAWCLALVLAAASASAGPVFVGSWDLYSGPKFISGAAPVQSGQQAAAALFGGDAADYVISTNGEDAAAIDLSAWYFVYGTDGYAMGLQDLMVDDNGLGIYDHWGDTSAMVIDGDHNPGLKNYAFRMGPAAPGRVPEPLTCALMGVGLMGMALARRRKPN